ncbi:MAG: caspase family protein [Bacteroidetes bacterium]|nr:caspase family protein [Bacteroidota bacterium]
MPTLYALLVGIDQYPNPAHALNGCVNDVERMYQFLDTYCTRMGVVFYPLVLTNEAAGRQAIIEGFDHFQQAQAGDACLFHFSGHGSRCAAPEAFWEFEPDHYQESIVCWDSRQPDGYDLMDKELSYLIWSVSKHIDVPFVTTMDCCHSGRMRHADDAASGVRLIREFGPAVPASELLGIDHFKKMKDGALRPPMGRRVHLAAARDTELAKEITIVDKPGGIFTYCLVEALENTGASISYHNLLERIRQRIRNIVRQQSPQLDATFQEDRNLGFLFSKIESEHPSFLVSWDHSAGWVLHAGAMHGIPPSEPGNPTVLQLQEDEHLVTVETVFADHSAVSGMEGYDTKRSYGAVIRLRAKPKLNIAFASGSDSEGVSFLTAAIENRGSDLFQLCSMVMQAECLVHAKNGTYFLSRTHHDLPFFEPIQGYGTTTAIFFLQKLEVVANWLHTLNLSNHNTRIPESDITIELYRVTEPGNESDNAPVELVDWQTDIALFRYTPGGSRPGFQLKIRNTGQQPYWIGVLYLDSNFAISNALLPKQELQPGQEVWATDVFENYQYRTIPLRIDLPDLSAVDEYIKVVICTGELNTEPFVQKGLSAHFPYLRSDAKRQHLEQTDWTAYTIRLSLETKDSTR